MHIPDPGRLRELLVPGAEVLVRPAGSPGRRTSWSLVGVRTAEGIPVSLDSRLPNLLVGGLLGTARWPACARATEVRREVPAGGSRFDFAFAMDGRRWWLEVKGCTLVREGVGLFPDAPTVRGARHVRELAALAAEGHGAAVVFVIGRPDASSLAPNAATDPDFARALAGAAAAGVRLHALLTLPRLGDSLEPLGEVPVVV
jgi:sugar fermentation stimulation protein A